MIMSVNVNVHVHANANILVMSILAFPFLGCLLGRCWLLRFFGAIIYLRSLSALSELYESPPR